MAQRRDVVILNKGDYSIYKLHGSQYGGCIHRHVMDFLNPDAEPTPPSDFQESIFARGNKAEAWVKEQLQEAGWSVRGLATNFADQVNVSAFDAVDLEGFNKKDRLQLSVSLDGVISRPSKGGLDTVQRRLEVKNLGKKGFTETSESPDGICAIEQYAYQVSGAAWGIDWKAGEKGDIRSSPVPVQVVITRQGKSEHDESLQIYEDAEHYPKEERLFLQTIAEPFFSAEQCMARCRLILQHCRDATVPPCDARYPCPWTAWEKEQATVHCSNSRLEELLASIDSAECDLQFLAESIQRHKEEVKQMVRAEVSSAAGIVTVGDWRVNLTKTGRLIIKNTL